MPEVLLPETQKFLLSVSDSSSMEQSLYQWLHENGVVIVRAGSTEKAMELLGRAQYNAVITNLRRVESGRKNDDAGIELTQQIRRSSPHVPIFIYTMNIDLATRQSALASGATMITTNPTELRSGLKKYDF